jgi:ACS family pantothenate transporter-like MFS transporter
MPVDLDRSNVTNAYVSGMKEELNMQGNDYNVRFVSLSRATQSPLLKIGYFVLLMQKINTVFTCGYIVGMIPSKTKIIFHKMSSGFESQAKLSFYR